MLRQTFIALVLAIVAVSALPTKNETRPIDPPHSSWTDIIQGHFGPRSVLIHSSVLNGDDFSWRGENLITAIEIIELGNATLRQVSIRGGLDTDYLQLWSHTGPLHAVVNIFSEPLNFTFGFNDPSYVVLNSTRLTGQTIVELHLNSTGIIEVVELIDQTNGTGAYVNRIEGFGTRTLYIQLRTDLFRGRIDYIVNTYGPQANPSTGPNHFEYGQLTNSSVHITSQIISVADLYFGWFSLPLSNHTFDYLRLFDLTNGTGGSVYFARVNHDSLEIAFEESKESRFLLDVFGQPRTNNANSSDIIIGELNEDSILLSAVTLWEYGTEATFSRDFGFPIHRIEVLDQQFERNVRVTLVAGEVGGRHINVRFEAAQPSIIHYDIRVYGSISFEKTSM